MSRLINCPKCGSANLIISKEFTYIRSWSQEGQAASYYDFEEPDSWESDTETEFICQNQECNHVWHEDISVDELFE